MVALKEQILGMAPLKTIHAELERLSDPARASSAQRFFKTGPREYAEGDRFRGINVPELRKLAKTHRDLPFGDIAELLESEWHEDRLTALLLLLGRYSAGTPAMRHKVHRLYLSRIAARVNNWDLVDSSAAPLVGAHLAEYGGGDSSLLDRLARDRNLWRRRVGIVATHHFIRAGSYGETLRIAAALLGDREDLIHKATGWMLREMGKRDLAPLRAFLDRHAPAMPRTMLRYAIEKFPERARREYLGHDKSGGVLGGLPI
jgi:3-methyladenine DNA glycosylase AlkD